jgi:hypothetical protein
MVTALQALVDSGRVQSGTVARLETVPVPFLRNASLLEGAWLDRYVVELAEYDSLLKAKGYEASEDQDEHPLASVQFVSHDGQEVDQAETQVLRRQAVRSLAKFPGRTREIDGRPYLHFEDYRRWRGRKVKGDLQSGIQRGFVTTSWNVWVDAKRGEGVAALTGAPVEGLCCHVEPSQYQTFPDSEYRLGCRRQLLDDMRFLISSCETEAVSLQEWKECTQVFLAGLYAFQDAVALIGRRYFDGWQILFPDQAQYLADLVGDMEKLVGAFNHSFTGESGQLGPVDLGMVRQSESKEIAGHTSYLVDMAKADTLILRGEDLAATELLERYL